MPPKSLFEYVMAYSRLAQATIIAVTVLSFPIAYLTLEIPKLIIDDAILGSDFPRSFLGFSLSQVEYLLLLCAGFFCLFVLSNIIKYGLNILRGVTGERLLRRLRYMLVGRIMRLKRGDERHYSAGEVVQIVVAELQPIGGFVGEYFAVPVMQGGTLLVFFLFIFVQDPFLGMAAVALFPIQAYIIPKMQKRVIRLTQERIANARLLSDEVAENVDGIEAFRAHSALDWRLSQLSDRLFQNFKLRYKLFKQKFLIKFVNNLLNQVMPFFFYTLGGYLVIVEQLQIGALVSAIAAYKELSSPWKELLKYYETHSDLSIRYASIMERFSDGEEAPSVGPQGSGVAPSGALEVGPLTAGGATIGAGKTARAGQVVSVVGGESAARGVLMRAIAGVEPPTAGQVRLGGRSLADLPNDLRAETVALIERQPFFPRGSLRDALSLGLARPQALAPGGEVAPWWRKVAALTVETGDAEQEAIASGNFARDPHADVLDFARAGVADAAGLDARIIELAVALGVERPVFERGLAARIDPVTQPELAREVLDMRAALEAADDGGLEDVVERWRPDALNMNAPLVENILYAAARDPAAAAHDLESNRHLDAWLGGSTVEPTLLAIGAEVVEATAELLEGQSADSPLLRGFDLYPADKVDQYRADAVKFRSPDRALGRGSRRRLLGVALAFTPGRRRLNVLSEARIAALVAARAQAQDLIIAAAYDAPGADFAPIRADRYLPGLTVQENLLLGKLRLDRRDQWGRINARLWELARERGTDVAIAQLGLAAPIDAGLKSLPVDQRERFAILRGMLPRPRVLALNGPGGSESLGDSALVEALRRAAGEAIVVVNRSGAPVDAEDGVVLDLDAGTRGEASAPPAAGASRQEHAGGADVA